MCLSTTCLRRISGSALFAISLQHTLHLANLLACSFATRSLAYYVVACSTDCGGMAAVRQHDHLIETMASRLGFLFGTVLKLLAAVGLDELVLQPIKDLDKFCMKEITLMLRRPACTETLRSSVHITCYAMHVLTPCANALVLCAGVWRKMYRSYQRVASFQTLLASMGLHTLQRMDHCVRSHVESLKAALLWLT
eukprot:8704-Heterococcus_DN1.PRE.1